MTDPVLITRRTLLQSGGLAAVLLSGGGSLLAACGGDDGDAAAPTEGGATAQGELTQLDLRLGAHSEPDTLNPLTTTGTPGDLHWLIYDKLMVFDEELKPELWLAKSVDVSPDGRVITYTIPEGVTFHDGQPLTSADIKFSFEIVRDTQLSFASAFMEGLQSVETPDELTAVATFNAVPSLDPAVMAVIVPKHLWEGKTKEQIVEDPNEQPVGSGAFKFVEFKRGETITIERYDDWWGEPPSVSRVIRVFFANQETEAQALRAGDIDVTGGLVATIWDGLKGAEDVTPVELPGLRLAHYGFNVWDDPASRGNPLLKDRVVRQALAHAVDRQKLVDLVVAGHGVVGDSVLMPGLADWYYDIPADREFGYDPERARSLLEDAGYMDRDGDGVRESPDGQPLRFRLIASTGADAWGKAAELIVPMSREIGVEYEYTALDEATVVSKVFQDGDWDAYVWAWTTPPDPIFMLSIQTCAQFHNLSDTYYCNPEFEELYKQQLAEPDPARRGEIIDELQQIFHDDAAYVVLWYDNVLQAYRTDRITGWPEIPNGVVQSWSSKTYFDVKPA
jgi:peptide/nickel transport system substrate-binding protein